MMADYEIDGQHVFNGMVMQSGATAENIRKVTQMSFADGDFVIATYPKAGTTWMEHLALLVSRGGEDTPGVPLHQQVRYLEYMLDGKTAGVDLLENDPRPAIMKTHLPATFLERQIKEGAFNVIVVVRNPKDTLVSAYNFYRMNKTLGNFPGSWHDFFEMYKRKKIIYGDYFDWYESWLPYMDLPNVQVIHYEDMKFEMFNVIQKLSKFMGKSLDNNTIEKIIFQTSFDAMKNNNCTNYEEVPIFDMKISPFMRKGQVGDWKNYFTDEQSKQVDYTYQERLANRGMVLRFE